MLYDKDIREPLFSFLEDIYGKTRIFEEKIMGSSRADVVMVTCDALYGIEIKSDADSYSRLSRQIKDYDRYFDYNYVAVGTSHAKHIEEHVPPHWGIITIDELDGQADFYILRKPLRNSSIEPKLKLSLLWRPELARIQERNGLPAYKGASKKFVIGKICSFVPYELLSSEISEELFERDYNIIQEEIDRFRIEKGLLPKKKTKRKYIKGKNGAGSSKLKLRKGPDLLVSKVVHHAKRKKKTVAKV